MPDRFLHDYGRFLLICGDRPYEKLQRALKAEVDEAGGTVRHQSAAPSTGTRPARSP